MKKFIAILCAAVALAGCHVPETGSIVNAGGK